MQEFDNFCSEIDYHKKKILEIQEKRFLWSLENKKKIKDIMPKKGEILEINEEVLDYMVKGLVDEKVREKIANEMPNPTFAHQLYDHLYDEHGLILLESELDEIIRIVKNMK